MGETLRVSNSQGSCAVAQVAGERSWAETACAGHMFVGCMYTCVCVCACTDRNDPLVSGNCSSGFCVLWAWIRVRSGAAGGLYGGLGQQDLPRALAWPRGCATQQRGEDVAGSGPVHRTCLSVCLSLGAPDRGGPGLQVLPASPAAGGALALDGGQQD